MWGVGVPPQGPRMGLGRPLRRATGLRFAAGLATVAVAWGLRPTAGAERIKAVVVAAADVVTLEGATCWVTPAAVDAGPAVELEPCEAAAPPVGRER